MSARSLQINATLAAPPSAYEKLLARGERRAFSVDEVLPPDAQLDFTRPFLPEALAGGAELTFLSAPERRALNHVRAHGYLTLFGLVEGFILPFVLDQVQRGAQGGDARTRALLQFASEEAKHMALFERFQAVFERGFGQRCGAVGPAESVAREVLRRDPLGVALVILHIEWMTQRHYLESVHADESLEPAFKELLRFHWLEEAQHAQLDTLLVEELAALSTASEIELGVTTYLEIVAIFDELLGAQRALDLASLERAIGRRLVASELTLFHERQARALRWTFLGSGMTHPNFQASLEKLSGAAAEQVRRAAQRYA